MVRCSIFSIMESHFTNPDANMLDLSEWKPEYSVGHTTLDAQHKKLLQVCRRVSTYRCDGTKASIEAFHSILSELAFYADKHFASEENLLRQIGFPHLQQQIEEHDAYREWLTEFLFLTMNGKIDKSSLQNYLESWWLSHILASDMQYASLFAGHPPEISRS